MRTVWSVIGAAGVAGGIAALTLAADATRSEAMITYPWCAHYGGRMSSGINCGFSTYEQCMAAISGNGGYCAENAWYAPPAPPARHRKSRPSQG